MGGGMMMTREPVKVVIINTQYVETDALSFKSVVQRLTGKDSTVAAAADQKKPESSKSINNINNATSSGRVPERGVSSFKDFDRMLKELPSLDELYALYAE